MKSGQQQNSFIEATGGRTIVQSIQPQIPIASHVPPYFVYDELYHEPVHFISASIKGRVEADLSKGLFGTSQVIIRSVEKKRVLKGKTLRGEPGLRFEMTVPTIKVWTPSFL
jgi:hypothetical protein